MGRGEGGWHGGGSARMMRQPVSARPSGRHLQAPNKSAAVARAATALAGQRPPLFHHGVCDRSARPRPQGHLDRTGAGLAGLKLLPWFGAHVCICVHVSHGASALCMPGCRPATPRARKVSSLFEHGCLQGHSFGSASEPLPSLLASGTAAGTAACCPPSQQAALPSSSAADWGLGDRLQPVDRGRQP